MTTPQKIAQYLATAEARRSGTDGAEFYRPGSSSIKSKAKSPTKSPTKYHVVKSKVAGNMKSIKKSQTRAMLQKHDMIGGSVESPVRVPKHASPKKRKSGAASQMPGSYQDQIINEIKNKYSKDAINQMSHEQLANEILNM